MLLWTGIIPSAVFAFAITVEACVRQNVGKVRKLPGSALGLIIVILLTELYLINVLLFMTHERHWMASVHYITDVIVWAILGTSYSYCCNGITVFRTNYWTVKLTYVYKLV
jgi:hypothetical protein